MDKRQVSLGYVPHGFQAEARAKILLSRFAVLVCHRRWGKTVFAVMELILGALSAGSSDFRAAYMAPFRKQAKDVTWDYFKRFAGRVPGVLFNETELAVTFPNGARITLYGTDNADALRGLYLDYAVMDEVADMKPFVWGEVIRPALADRKGRCLFIGTPKGLNLFFDLYNRGLSGERGWRSLMYRASDTVDRLPWLDGEELENAKRDLSPNQYRQEFECDFNASCDNALITLDVASAAVKRVVPESEYRDDALVFGVDVARFGGDACVLQARRGRAAFPPERHVGIDNMTFAGMVHHRICGERPALVFVDAGRGEGVIDRLRQLQGPAPIVEVPFGGKADEGGVNGYVNKRAEMWDRMRKWLETGSIPRDSDLLRELVTPTYTFDAQNRMRLESKETIRDRVGFSPDRADALALTIAHRVLPMERRFAGRAQSVRRSDLMFVRDEFQLGV